LTAELPQQTFRLLPFAQGPDSPGAGLTLSGTISRRAGVITITYTLQGDPAGVVLPPEAAPPARRDGLWQSTCFECFLAVAGGESYWEVNLSPGGDWNVYRLDGYRRNLRPEPAIQALPHRSEHHSETFSLQLTLPLPPEIAAIRSGELEAGITAVLEHPGGGISYWALVHPGPEADFHRRDGFRLRL
jgi:hypothetical protein